MIYQRNREEDTLGTRGDQGRGARALLPLLVLVIATVAPAATPARVERLLSLAQVPVRVEEWTSLSVVGSDWAAARLDRATLTLLEREAMHAFDPARLLEEIASELARADAREVAAVLAFGDTPLGRRGFGVDRGPLRGEQLRGQPEYASRVMLEGMEGPRWQTIRRFDAATGMTRDTLLTGAALGLAIGAGAHALACLPPQDWPAAESRLVRRLEPLARLVEARVAGEIGFRFDDLPTTDLTRLARFAETDGAWLYARIGEALGAALVRARDHLSERLAPEIAARCSQ